MKFDNLHQILRSLYEQMMPLCGDMAGVAKGIAGLGALFYVCLLYTSVTGCRAISARCAGDISSLSTHNLIGGEAAQPDKPAVVHDALELFAGDVYKRQAP